MVGLKQWDGVVLIRVIPSREGVGGQTERNGGALEMWLLVKNTVSAI